MILWRHRSRGDAGWEFRGWDAPTAVCTEESSFGHGLTPEVGRAREEGVRAGAIGGAEGGVLRTGFVVGRDRGSGGGAHSRLERLARWGLGGESRAGGAG